MKKLNLIAFIASSMLFVACGNQTSSASGNASEAAGKVAEMSKDTASKAVESAKDAAKEAAAAKEEAAKAAQAAKEAAAKAAEATAPVADKAKEVVKTVEEKAKTVVDATKEAVDNAMDTVKEKSSTTGEQAKEEAASAASSAKGASLFAKCAGCHGKDGKTKALGKFEIIAGQSADELEKKISAYKAGTRNVTGMGTLMKGQVAGYSDADIKAVAAYISTLR